MKKYYRLFVLVAVFLVAGAAQAQTIPAVDLGGFAWSSNIGWISLNCKNDNNCTTSDYKVTINADRSITGYGWSSNIGWVKFGGLSSFPAGGGTTAGNAQMTGTYPNLTMTGWARACAGTNGGNCSSMANNPAAGAWDGWISLRGTNYAVSANMSTGMNANSYAWGSDIVGWVDMFSNVTFDAANASLVGTGCTIPVGSNSCSGTLTWNIADTIASPSVYKASPAPAGQLSTNRYETNRTVTLSFGNTTYQARSGTTVLAARTLSATCAAGLVHNGTQCVVGTATSTPTINLTAVPSVVRSGGTTAVNWNLSTIVGSTCVINGPGLSNVAVTTANGSMRTGAITSATTVRMTCTGTYGSVEERVSIEVIPVAEEV